MAVQSTATHTIAGALHHFQSRTKSMGRPKLESMTYIGLLWVLPSPRAPAISTGKSANSHIRLRPTYVGVGGMREPEEDITELLSFILNELSSCGAILVLLEYHTSRQTDILQTDILQTDITLQTDRQHYRQTYYRQIDITYYRQT